MGMDAKADVWFGPSSREMTREESTRMDDKGCPFDFVPSGLDVGTVYYEGGESYVFVCTSRHHFDWDLGDQRFEPVAPDPELIVKLADWCATLGFEPDSIGWHCLCNYS